MTGRSRKETKLYQKHKKEEHAVTQCVFCDIEPKHTQFLRGTRSFKVITNIFPYSTWDNQDVSEHILLVPKRHIDSLNGLTRDEAVEYVDVVASYESRGYNVWSRAPQSVIKSVAHQHTHLIKPGEKTLRFLFYLQKPYVRLRR